MIDVPLIDLRTSTPAAVYDAVSNVGFFHLALAGTPLDEPGLVARMFEVSNTIHGVPLAEREGCFTDQPGNGYTGMSGSLSERAQSRPDFRETLLYGRCLRADGTMAPKSEQKLPDSIEYLRDEVQSYVEKCHAALRLTLDKISVAFELEESFFSDRHKEKGFSAISFLNYPALPEPPLEDDIRAGSHKDWGDLTLLFFPENAEPGLQIFVPHRKADGDARAVVLSSEMDESAGDWISAPVRPGTVLVNCGLSLEAMTGGVCRAAFHRVIFPKGGDAWSKNRKTIAFFGTPDPQCVMNPVSKGGKIEVKEGAPTVREFFEERQRLASGYIKKPVVAAAPAAAEVAVAA